MQQDEGFVLAISDASGYLQSSLMLWNSRVQVTAESATNSTMAVDIRQPAPIVMLLRPQLDAIELRAQQHHDWSRLADVYCHRGIGSTLCGDLHAAIPQHQRGLEIARRIGNRKYEAFILLHQGNVFLALGDLSEAEQCFLRAHELLEDLEERLL